MNSEGWGQWVLNQTTWANNNVVGSYLKLRDPMSFKSVEAKLPPIVEQYAGEALKQFGRKKILTLQPLDEIRLHSKLTNRHQTGNSVLYVYMIMTIGVMILVLACINFMNLTTARSAQRAGEVGIRKSMGAQRWSLIRQFLGESMVIVFFCPRCRDDYGDSYVANFQFDHAEVDPTYLTKYTFHYWRKSACGYRNNVACGKLPCIFPVGIAAGPGVEGKSGPADLNGFEKV
ncbi:MAG: FtsX-like permease family protein [Bacteroidota bacterium]